MDRVFQVGGIWRGIRQGFCMGSQTQTVHPWKLRCTIRKHRTVFCCSGWPLGHLQNGCLSERLKGDVLPPQETTRVKDQVESSPTVSIFRNNHPKEMLQIQLVAVFETVKAVSRFSPDPAAKTIQQKKDCFQTTLCKTNKHCFRNKHTVSSSCLS